MSDVWLTLDDDQLRDEVISLGQEATELDPGPAVGVVQGLWETLALTVQHFFGVAVRPIRDHADPRRATGIYLRAHGLNAGVPMRAARATQGRVTVTSVAGGRLSTGDVIAAGGQTFGVDNDVRLGVDVATSVPITAATAGAAGNLAPGVSAQFSPTPDRASDAVVEFPADWIGVYGHDADDPDDNPAPYRERVQLGFAIKGDAHVEARYRLAVRGVPGVSSMAVARTPRGYGSVDVLVLFEGRLPTEAELDLVRAALTEAGLTGGDLLVRAPRVVTVAVTAEITGTAVTTDVEQAIADWFSANVGIGAGLLVQTLYSAFPPGSVPGMTSIAFSSPVSNLSAAGAAWYSPAISVTQAP